jgi:hypothetical protein
MLSLFELFTSLETEIQQIETLKYSFEKNKQMCFIVPHAWVTMKQMQPIFLSSIRSTGNLSWSTLYYFYEGKNLLSLLVLRKFIFLCYTQDYNEKYTFRFTVPHPPLHTCPSPGWVCSCQRLRNNENTVSNLNFPHNTKHVHVLKQLKVCAKRM